MTKPANKLQCEHFDTKIKSIWFEHVTWAVDQIIDLLECRLGYTEKKDKEDVLRRLELAKKARKDICNAAHAPDDKEADRED